MPPLGLPRLATADPVLWLPLFLGTLRDYSGHGNHGTASGGYWQASGGADGYFSNASGTKIEIADSPELQFTSFTAFWWGPHSRQIGATRFLSKRDAGGTQVEIFAATAASLGVFDGAGVPTRAASVIGRDSFAVCLENGGTANLYLDGVLDGAFGGTNTITANDAPLNICGSFSAGQNWANNVQGVILYPAVLTPAEIATLHDYSQSRITPRKQWPGGGLRYPDRGDPYTPATGDLMFLDNIQTARVSLVASETSGKLSNTPYQIESGGFRVAEDATTGERYIECVAAGIISRRNLEAYGTWEWDVLCPVGASFLAGFVAPSPDTSITPLYRFAHTVTGEVSVLRVGIAYIMRSAAGFAVLGNRYRYRITRSAVGEFTTWIKGGAFVNWTLADASATGSNPGTQNTITTSVHFSLNCQAGDRLYLDRQFANVVSPI